MSPHASGTGELHKTHGISFADVGNTGNEDLLVQVGGATPGDSHAFRLFRNPGSGNDWINLHLVGVKSNRAAIGARIKITVENEEKRGAPFIALWEVEDRLAHPLWRSISD